MLVPRPVAGLLAATFAIAVGGAVPPDEFPLHATPGHEPASGQVRMVQPWSPFGISVTADGTVRYGLSVETADLPPIGPGEEYVVWLASPDLGWIRRMGALDAGGRARGSIDGARFLAIVSRETRGAPGAGRWEGPIVLRGSSPGSRVAPLWGHSFFQQSPM